MSKEMAKEFAKGFYVDDKFTLTNGDEKKSFVVSERNDEVEDAPEYTLKCIETDEFHGPVHWQWLDRDDLELIV